MQKHSLVFSPSKLIVIIYERDSASLISRLADVCCLGWEQSISIRVITSAKEDSREFTEKVIDEFYDTAVEKIFFQVGLLDQDLLSEESVSFRSAPTTKTLFQAMLPCLKKLNFHWQAHAQQQWEKSSLRSASPEQWVQQFAELDCRDIARHILKSLRIVTDAEIKESFHISSYDEIGLRIAHGYIHEDEPGSSSIAIRNILEHMHPEGSVIPVDLSNPEMFLKMDFDVLYIYEDGLWSGVEVVKRLKSLSENIALMQSNLQIVFKYCVTCDAGLSAARLFSVRNTAGRFQFPSAKSGYHYTFLKDGVDTRFPELAERTDETVRAAIDSVIEPYAFASREIWGKDRDSGLKVCSEIGSQLVKSFLERKAAKEKGGDVVEISLDKIKRLELGAMSFASTIVFASSIPKPVLPVMWLEGDVTLGVKKVKWRPLFWDARRTGVAEY